MLAKKYKNFLFLGVARATIHVTFYSNLKPLNSKAIGLVCGAIVPVREALRFLHLRVSPKKEDAFSGIRKIFAIALAVWVDGIGSAIAASTSEAHDRLL